MGMQRKDGISWADETWNPIVGCSKISPGCDHCWAERSAIFHHNNFFSRRWDGHVKLFPERLEQPLHWRKPRRIALALMGDIFHDQVPDIFIDKIFAVMVHCPHLMFQVLTKRPQRMFDYFRGYEDVAYDSRSAFIACQAYGDGRHGITWPLSNVWLGVSIENQKAADERMPILLQTPAAVRWLSCEPLLGPIDLSKYLSDWPDDYTDIDQIRHGYKRLAWCIVGGESGPGARPMHPDWVRSIRDQCQMAGVPFHFKQWGACPYPPGDISEWIDAGYDPYNRSKGGKELDGREWLEFPEVKS